MGLTPDVAPGALIQSSWGNEIRNRTIQQFATVAERNTWLSPPTGSVCVTVDTLTIWVRAAGAWQALPARSRGVVTTNANGEATVTHLMGGIPSVVLATPGSASVFLITENMTSTTFRVKATTAPGVPAANSSLSINWVAYP